MDKELLKCLEDIKLIKKYLIKKGKSRFKGNVIKNKLVETELIYKKCEEFVQSFSQKEIKPEKISVYISIFDQIKSIYTEILQLCRIPSSDSSGDSSEVSDYNSPCELVYSTMEFDLKTACNLIPVMNGNENTTKNLIDSVDMYADMLSDSGKKLLIKFVLKSRLSENAKLRMSTDYSSAHDLIVDLKKNLLTKKSFPAIQSKLQTSTQGWRTIEQYGSEIENLFSDLTISQADGNVENYALLKPINEKFAIKRFSDGLRDSRLSTIITARNYEHLKDAIQAAKDEELVATSTSTSENVMMSQHGRGRIQRNYYQRPLTNRPRTYQTQYQHQKVSSNRGNFNSYRGYSRGYSNNVNRGHNKQTLNNRARFSGARGRPNNRVFYANRTNIAERTNKDIQIDSEPSTSNQMQFFRS